MPTATTAIRRAPSRQFLFVLPFIFFVFAMGAAHLKSDPIAPNEFMTIARSFDQLVVPLTPADAINRVARLSAQHGPAYFALVSAWAALTGIDLATLRLVSVFAGMLAVAAIYRLALISRDKRLALYAAIFASFCSIFIFYSHELRMYAMLSLCCAMLTWSYWSLLVARGAARPLWLVFFAAAASILYVHYFGIIVLLAIGAYHLLFAPKDKHWLRITLVAFAAGLAFLPWLLPIIENVMPGYSLSDSRLLAPQSLWTLLDIFSNGLPVLGLALALIVLFRFTSAPPSLRYLVTVTVFALVIALLVNEITTIFVARRMRYALLYLPFFAVIFGAGLRHLPLPNKWRSTAQTLLLAVFIAAFFAFNNSARMYHYTEGERWRLNDAPPLHLLAYYPEIAFSWDEPILTLHPETDFTDFAQKYYSKRYKPAVLAHIHLADDGAPIVRGTGKDIDDLEHFVGQFGRFWLVTDPRAASRETMPGIFHWIYNFYRSCGALHVDFDAVIERFVRDSFAC